MKPMLSTELNMPETVTEKAKIEVRNLNFYYGESKALKVISLSLPERSTMAVSERPMPWSPIRPTCRCRPSR